MSTFYRRRNRYPLPPSRLTAALLYVAVAGAFFLLGAYAAVQF